MSRIEVEKKFIITSESLPLLLKFLLKKGEPIGSQTISDTYYDDSNLSLICSGKRLRNRTVDMGFENWQIKESCNQGLSEIDDNIEYDEKDIRNILDLGSGSMEKEIALKDYKPLCKIVSYRRSYKVGQFTISTDNAKVEGSGWAYRLGEIELIIDSKDYIQEAKSKINVFINNVNKKSIEKGSEKIFVDGIALGKLPEYLRRKKQHLFNLMIKAEVVREGSKL